MSRLDSFLQEVTLRYGSSSDPRVLAESLREIRLQLEDSRDAFITEGMAREEAELAAIKAFGDPRSAMPSNKPLFCWGFPGAAWMAVCGGALGTFLCLTSYTSIPTGIQYPLDLLAVAICFISGFGYRRVFFALIPASLLAFMLWIVPTDGAKQPYHLPAPVPLFATLHAIGEQRINNEQNRILNAYRSGLESALANPSSGGYSVVFEGQVRYPRGIVPRTSALNQSTQIDPTYEPGIRPGYTAEYVEPAWSEGDFFPDAGSARKVMLENGPHMVKSLASVTRVYDKWLATARAEAVPNPAQNFLTVVKSNGALHVFGLVVLMVLQGLGCGLRVGMDWLVSLRRRRRGHA